MRFYFIIFIFNIVFYSCGTETGNPFLGKETHSGTPPPAENDSQSDLLLMSHIVLEKVCSKLSQCFFSKFNSSNCFVIIESIDGFDLSFELNSDFYDNYKSIIQAESSGKLVGKETELNQCLKDIDDLNCQDSEVINAYDESQPLNFMNLYRIIPVGAGSCQSIF